MTNISIMIAIHYSCVRGFNPSAIGSSTLPVPSVSSHSICSIVK